MTFTTLVIAVALAMDAFAVAIGTGATLKSVDARQTFRLAWHFGLFQALMPILGWVVGWHVQGLIEAFDHWIAFGLLAFVGVRMIRESLDPDPETPKHDPTRGVTLVMLSVATSIDALAVGLSMAVLRVSVWVPAAIIGVVAALFTVLGLQIGRWAGAAGRWGRLAEIGGGLVLVGIGVKILVEHGALAWPWAC